MLILPYIVLFGNKNRSEYISGLKIETKKELSYKDGIIEQSLNTHEGREAIAKAMIEPFRRKQETILEETILEEEYKVEKIKCQPYHYL
jgi:hypothetical protein